MSKYSTLDELHIYCSLCTNCSLYRNCYQIVVGKGNPNAKLMIIGESPSGDDELSRIPFSDRFGLMLNDFLDEIELSRNDVYITNAVKCNQNAKTPPKTKKRPPYFPEISACRPWLDQELELIKPKAVLCLGRVALISVLRKENDKLKLSNYFNQILTVDYAPFKIIPSYHLSYICYMKKDIYQHVLNNFRKAKELLDE